MRRMIIILLLLAGCTTTETVIDRVEVPAPYWDPPENVQTLPPRAPVRALALTPEEAAADTQAAFRTLAEDIRALIEENEHIRHLYEELVKLIEEEPE